MTQPPEPSQYQPGPFDSMHLYLQWSGVLPGNEQFSCGLRFASAGAVTSLDPVGMLAGVTAAVVAYHTDGNTGISSRAMLNSVKLNAIGEDGLYVEPGTTEQVMANVGGGLNSVAHPPNQVALAVSLTTGFSRGPAHRGRFYLPMPLLQVDANGVIPSLYADGVSDSTDTFIAALNAVDPQWKVAVFSRKLAAAAHRLVTGNEVGRVLDTQRRRRRSLVEDYQ